VVVIDLQPGVLKALLSGGSPLRGEGKGRKEGRKEGDAISLFNYHNSVV